MFQFFSILLLLTSVLHIVEAIKIWVKPSNLRYTAEIICLNIDGPLTIGTATHASSEVGTTGYVNIGTDLSRCDDANPNVKVQITNLDRLNESMEFEILKTELLARKSAVVLGFNIAASARKIFYFQQFSSILRFFQRPLVDCELEIECDYQPSGSTTQYIVFGSEVQRHGQNNIIIPIYETEMLTFCGRGRIGLAIRNAEHERTTFINVTREFLLENDAFNINVSNETIQPILQGHNDPALSRTIESLSTIPSGASSSTTGQVESSTIATTHDEAGTSSQAAKTESDDEMESKQQSKNKESVSGKNICSICLHRMRKIAFVPCGHLCACPKCSEKIMNLKKHKCPICRKRIEKPLFIYFP